MILKETQLIMQQWLAQAIPPERQLDQRWIGRYRELTAHDSYWWLSWAGPFTEEEQQQWDRLFTPPIDEATKTLLAPFLKQSRERELEAAFVEQREPRLHYPAIEIDEVRRQITGFERLDSEIAREEPNEIVRLLYHGAIEDEANYLRMIEATYEGDTDRYWALNRCIFHEPTVDEMVYAFSRLRRMLQQGFERSETVEISQCLVQFLHEQLHVSLDLSVGKDDPPAVYQEDSSEKTISAKAAKNFFATILRASGYEGWQVSIDAGGGGARVEWGLRQLFLSGESFSLERIRHLLAHELAGHVARGFAGEHSPIGLLGIGTKGHSPTEEGLALYHEREALKRSGYPFVDSGQWFGMLEMGLASGIVTPPQTFSSLYKFFEMLLLLHRRLWLPWQDAQTAQERVHTFAFSYCLRTYRGVPDLGQAGVCHLQDVGYLRGLLLIDQAVAKDETVLDRLAVGIVAYDLLPILQPLQMVPPPQPLRELAYDPDLDSYVLSFEASSKEAEEEK